MDREDKDAINAVLDDAMQHLKAIERSSFLKALEGHIELNSSTEKELERQQLLNKCIESALNLNLWHKNHRIDISRLVHEHGFYSGLATMAGIFDDIQRGGVEYV